MVQQPAKVMRIGTMIKQLLEEVRAAPLDEGGRARLREIHESSIAELEQGCRPNCRPSCTGSACPSVTASRPRPNCASPRRSWSAGSKGSSTASRPRSPSRWRCASTSSRRRRALPGGRWPGGPVAGQGRVVIGPGGQIIAVPEAGGGPDAGRHGETWRRPAAPASTSERACRLPYRRHLARRAAGSIRPATASSSLDGSRYCGDLEHARVRVGDRVGLPGPGQHRQVVGHVADRGDLAGVDAVLLGDVGQPRRLGDRRPRRSRAGRCSRSG